jgi:hypothetical protein
MLISFKIFIIVFVTMSFINFKIYYFIKVSFIKKTSNSIYINLISHFKYFLLISNFKIHFTFFFSLKILALYVGSI